jgi:FkbM family methyltransferase
MGQAERFSAYNYALGETEGTAKFHRSQAAETSSLLLMTDAHKHAYPHTAPTSEVAVEVRRLDSVLTAPLARPAFAKIDVQGAEASVLRGGSATLAQVDLLIIETSFAELYAGQPLFGELYELLLELGFEYAGSFDQLLHPKDERILQQDAIFLRRANA